MIKNEKDSKYKEYQKRRRKKIQRSQTRKKSKIKQLRKSLENKTSRKKHEIKKFKKYSEIHPPNNFSFLENTEDVINFINKVESNYKKNKSVFINLENVEFIDYGAITVLLSVMTLFKSSNIKFNGNFPKNQNVRKKIVDSQFFNRIRETIFKEEEYTIVRKDQIFTKANKIVDPTLGYNIIKQSSETIWGEKKSCPGIQRVLLELMQNTHNHASIYPDNQEYWWLSVNHDPEKKKVSFVFVDYGQGIFESLEKKPETSKWYNFSEKLKEKLKYGNRAEILKLLLEGDLHMTVTGQNFRGKGLPGIMQVSKRNQISNLYIISNDVFADTNKNMYKMIRKKFQGTFLYWELCYNNEHKIWNI